MNYSIKTVSIYSDKIVIRQPIAFRNLTVNLEELDGFETFFYQKRGKKIEYLLLKKYFETLDGFNSNQFLNYEQIKIELRLKDLGEIDEGEIGTNQYSIEESLLMKKKGLTFILKREPLYNSKKPITLYHLTRLIYLSINEKSLSSLL